jgi:transcriptional regulator with XRE-family HTH domain
MSEKSRPPKEMMPTTRHIGGRLRFHRKRLGQSPEAVAGKANLTVLGLHNLETGKASSRSDNYERVAKALKMIYPIIIAEAYLAANGAGEFVIAEFSGLFAVILLKYSSSQATSRSDEESPPPKP